MARSSNSAGEMLGATASSDAAPEWTPAPGRGTFVGRERELAQIDPALTNALAGRGGLVVLAGDPGIGKTRTAEEVAASAYGRGAGIYWGRCHEGAGAPAYWPWLQILRSLVRQQTPRALAGLLGEGAGAIAQVVPELRLRLGDLPAPPALEPEQARFQLFDCITGFLRAVAARRPLVLVLDDLHWADTPSLLLLQFLARETDNCPLLLVGTYRELEVDGSHPFAPVLNELCRVRGFVRVPLRGLAADAVRDLATGMCGRSVSPGFAEALLRRTEGNPFFVEELMRHCAEEGVTVGESGSSLEQAGTPEGVQAVIRRRLARLTESCNRALAVAAVIGRSFDAPLLREVLRGGEANGAATNLDRELQQARAARAIIEVPDAAERFRFAHALVRETLYEAQPRGERAALHRRIGEAFERLLGGPWAEDQLPNLRRAAMAELAYHFVQSGAGGEAARKALDYSTEAARQAVAALAYEEAAAHYERALEVLEKVVPDAQDQAQRRVQLLLALAEEQAHAGEPLRAKETYLRAAEAARVCASAEGLTRAALGFETLAADLGGSETDKVYLNLLEEAAAALGSRRDHYRARVLARLAQVPHRSMPRERRAAMSAEAVEIARQLGDPRTLSFALVGRNYAMWDSEGPAQRCERAEEIVRLAEEAGERGLALDGRMQRAFTLIELGRRLDLETEIHPLRRHAEQLRQPRYLWLSLILETAVAALSGEYAEAQRLAQEELAIGQLHNQSNAFQVYALQLFAVRRDIGGLEEVEPPLLALAAEHPIAAWHCALSFLYSEIGRETEARREFEPLAVQDFAGVPIDPLWLTSTASLAETCAFLGDAARAALLYPMLLPYADQAVAIGGAVSLGSVARHLGLLARTMRHDDDAIRHFEEALRFDAGMGALPSVARIQRDLALALLQRGRVGDRQRAVALLREALTTAERLDMKYLVERIRAEGEEALAAASAEAENVFHREGDYWTLAYGGRVVRLRDAKGLHYLALLLSNPRREFHVGDVLTAAHPSGRADTGAVLDAPAKAAYRSRLGELREELAEAERFNDVGRVENLRAEADAITQQLRSAIGSGGRDRRAGSYAERARLAVTQCVRASLKKIRAAHPALGHHLSTCVKTGYFCAYDPGPAPGHWRV